MHSLIYGESFYRTLLSMHEADGNSTTTSEQHAPAKWDIYQYGMCSLFVLTGCLVLCPLLQKRNYKSKQRKRILLVDALLLLLCLSRSVTLLFSYNQNLITTRCMIFLWAFGSTLMMTSLTVFLFILRSTTRLEVMVWKMRNTLVVTLVIVSNFLAMLLKEIIVLYSGPSSIRDWMVNFLLVLSSLIGLLYFSLGLYFCGTFRRINRNRRPSIRLVRETSGSKQSMSRVVHTDAKSYRSMVVKLRLLAALTFIKFAVEFYSNIKLMVILNSLENIPVSEWEEWVIEILTRMVELATTIVVFCVGFFSSQHKEAARQWIRSLSISKSHDDLTARRTMSGDSIRDTQSEERSRTATLTLDPSLSDKSNETVGSSLGSGSAHSPLIRTSDCGFPDMKTGTCLKQDSKYLMVPTAFPLVIEMVSFSGTSKHGKR